jgi:hypothetical protein
VRLLDINHENSIPTYFAVMLLVFAAALLGIISALKRKAQDAFYAHWTILAFTFLFLAIDEAASIHEMLIRPMRELLGDRARGVFHFAWVIPGIVITFVYAMVFVSFVFHLPIRIRLRVLLAATLYVGGAIGFELIGGKYVERHGWDLTSQMIGTVEESLELAGAILFADALLGYLADYSADLRFRILHGNRNE